MGTEEYFLPNGLAAEVGGSGDENDNIVVGNRSAKIDNRGESKQQLLARFVGAMKTLRFQDPTQSKPTLEGGLVVRVENGVRRVYLPPSDAAAANYYVGWIVDTDLEACSICSLKWTWMRTRHHCRACGSLVCSACSPYRAQLANFTSEDGGSRCCTQCFGLKMSSTQQVAVPSSSSSAPEASAQAASAVTTTMSMDAYDAQTRKFEAEQRPLYQIAYEQTRGLVPLDVQRSSVQKMVQEGLPESIAARLWRCRSLWLVCMATEDIAKVHIADFRSKYDFHGLDLVEMRALWFVLENVEWDRNIPSLVSKCEWRDGLKSKLDEMASKEADDCLPAQEQRNVAYRGHENLRVYDPEIKIEPRYLGIPNSAVAGISPCRAAAASAGSVRQTPARVAASSPTLSITPIPAPSAAAGEEPCDEEALDAEIDSWKLSPLPAMSPLPPPVPTESDDALSPLPESAVLSPMLPKRTALSRRRAPSLVGADGAAMRSPLRPLSSPVRTAVPFVNIQSPLNTSECEDDKDKEREEAPSSAALMAALFGGRAGEARALRKRGASIDRAMATTILLHCAEDPDSLAEPLETLRVLVGELGAEVDPTTDDGKTALLLLCFNADLGSFLVNAGADVLRDDCEGSNALQTTFEYGIEYMLETFVSCGREEILLQSGSDEDKNKYLCVLIFGGHASKAQALLKDNRVPPIDPEALPELLEVFKSNMESWHEPVDTYELLESWGAKW